MSAPGNTLPLAVTRALELRCERCDAEALPGKRLCQAHLDDARARRRKADKKRRDKRRRDRRCVDCRKPCRRRRCPNCWKRSRGANQKSQGANRSDGNWRVDPGTNWMRFRGKGRRGRLTREEQIDEDIRDAGFAIGELKKFVEKATVLKRPDVMGLPTIQREAARREVGQHLGFAGRIVDDLDDRYR